MQFAPMWAQMNALYPPENKRYPLMPLQVSSVMLDFMGRSVAFAKGRSKRKNLRNEIVT
jgi:hypothetical protein